MERILNEFEVRAGLKVALERRKGKLGKFRGRKMTGEDLELS